MENLIKKQNDFIAQQLAEFFYEYFKKRDFKTKAKNKRVLEI